LPDAAFGNKIPAAFFVSDATVVWIRASFGEEGKA
jgi:hypothetical protein